MEIGQNRKETILIADDSEMNRSILADMLGEEYEIREAENGRQVLEALEAYGTGISLLLLDIVMPQLDGFGVLEEMGRRGWMDEIPVVMISAESSADHVERAYEMGATDFISRPFDARIVHRRVVNTLLLYAKQKRLEGMVARQIREKERQSRLMIDILSHIVEFRNGESGLHVRRVHDLTQLLLEQISLRSDRFVFSPADIAVISTASALHDIGKIAIPEEILNKPGRLDAEEMAVMRTHAVIGEQMLENLPMYREEPLVKVARQICRWHHERYDGRGYPDGLSGEEIPVCAQVVALADVYDALTSDRVYKKAVPAQEAIRMILAGECGAFDPVLLSCFEDLAPRLSTLMEAREKSGDMDRQTARAVVEESMQRETGAPSDRTLALLEQERKKHEFYAALTQEIQYEFTLSPPMVKLTPYGAKKLDIPEVIPDPFQDKMVEAMMGRDSLTEISDALRSTSPGHPEVTYDCRLELNGERRWYRLIARAMWSSEEPPRYTGAIGKAMDIHESHIKMRNLEKRASSDPLTGLLNHTSARERIKTRLAERPEGSFALVIFDLDHFKQANDSQGHLFGDQVLRHTARQLRRHVRSGDIVARVGGDEFLIFLEYKFSPEAAVKRIYASLGGEYEGFPISLSMGVARTETVGNQYEELFRAADNALYAVKRSGRGQYRFYKDFMRETTSAISPIEAEKAGQASNRKGEEEP